MGLTSKDDHIGGQGFNIWAGANVHSMYYLMETDRKVRFSHRVQRLWPLSATISRTSDPLTQCLCLPPSRPVRLRFTWPPMPAKPLPSFPSSEYGSLYYSNITKERLYHLFACHLGSLLYWRCLEDRVFKMTNEWEMNDMILQTIIYIYII